LHPDLKLGDTCYVAYDYTKLSPASVMSEAEYHHEGDTPVEESTDDEEDPFLEDANSMALASLGLSCCFS
jgi:hypothetical protein